MKANTEKPVTIKLRKSKQALKIAKLAEKEIKIMAFGPGMIRMVTHLDVSFNQIDEVCGALKKISIS